MFKTIIAAMILTVAAVVGVSAQTMTQNQFSVGANFLRSNVDVTVSPTTSFDKDTDSFGVSAGYTRFAKGKGNKVGTVGFATDLAVNFNSDEVTMVTALAGLQFEARNAKTAMPYLRVLGGVAHQNYTFSSTPTIPTFDRSNTSAAFDAGVGIDWRLGKGSNKSLRTGFDYLNTGFAGERQHNGRFTLGLVFN